jgi:hypothetical protein
MGRFYLMARISAKKKTGIKELLEFILLRPRCWNPRQPDKLARYHHKSGLDKGTACGYVIVKNRAYRPVVAEAFRRVRA